MCNKQITRTGEKALTLFLVIIGGIASICMMGSIYYSGYFRDEYVPLLIEVPVFVTYGMWALLFGVLISVIAPIGAYYTSSRKVKVICRIYWMIIITATCIFFVYGCRLVDSVRMGA